MGSYIQFFVRAGRVFAPVGTYFCSSGVYKAFMELAPYEKIKPLRVEDLNEAEAAVADLITDEESYIARQNSEIEWLKGTNLPADERMNCYSDCVTSITEAKKQINGLRAAQYFLRFLRGLVDEADTEARFGENPLGLDPAAYVYYGIDCSTAPTFEDLEK